MKFNEQNKTAVAYERYSRVYRPMHSRCTCCFERYVCLFVVVLCVSVDIAHATALLQEVGYFDDSDRGTDEDTSSDLSIDDFARQCMAIMDQARQKNGDGFHLRVDEDTWSVLLDDYVHDIVGLKYQDFGAVEQVANQSDINRAVYDVHEMMEREMAPANEHLRLPIQFITIFSFMRLASFAAAYHSLWKQLPDWKESPLRATLLGDDKIRQRYTSRDSHLVILDHDLDEFLESGEVSDPYGDDDSLVALKSLLQVGVWWGKHDNDFLRDLSSRFDHLLFHLKTTCKSFVSKHDPERYLASTFYLAGPRKDFRCYKLAVAQLIYRFRNTPGKEQLVALLRLVLVMWTSNQGFNTVADRVSPVSEDEAAGLHDIEDLPDADEDEKAETRAERDRIAASVAAVKEEFARARREVQARERGERPPLWRQIFDIFDQRFREVIAPYFVVQCQFDDLLKEIMRGLRLF